MLKVYTIKDIYAINAIRPQKHFILDSTLYRNHNIKVITFSGEEPPYILEEYKFVKIEREGEYIIGNKKIGRDTTTLVIPTNQIDRVKVENKGLSTFGNLVLLLLQSLLGGGPSY